MQRFVSTLMVLQLVTTWAANPTAAATISVNSTSMAVGNDGLCSLREAIKAANTDTPSGMSPGECPAGMGADVIVLGMGIDYILSAADNVNSGGANGLPVIKTDITIHGNGSRIMRDAAAPQFRIVEVGPFAAAVLRVDSVIFAGGRAVDGAGSSPHGTSGGCILNHHQLYLNDCTLQECVAGDGDPVNNGSGGNGGAIFTFGPMMIEASTFSSCSAGSSTGGDGGKGGALYVYNADAVIEGSVFASNLAGSAAGAEGFGGSGGAIYSDFGNLTVRDSSLMANVAGQGDYGGRGGGIVGNGGTLTLDHTTFTSNQAGPGNVFGGSGGALWAGSAQLVATSTRFYLNHAGAPGGGAGALHVQYSQSQLIGCSFAGNHAANGGDVTSGQAGNGGYGGAIHNNGELTMVGCAFAENQAGDGGTADPAGVGGGAGGGGAIYHQVGDLTLIDTYLHDNRAGKGGKSASDNAAPGGFGGAVFSQDNVTVERSAFVANRAGTGGNGFSAAPGGAGGALYLISSGNAKLVNSTLSANMAGNGGDAINGGVNGAGGNVGGAIYATVPLSLINVTINDNKPGLGGNGPVMGLAGTNGGLHVEASTSLVNTIIANSSPGTDCVAFGPPVSNLGHNIIQDGSCGFPALLARLAPLANNGFTPAHAPCESAGIPDASCTGTSPALNGGNDAVCAASDVEGVDQRGALRPGATHCEIGALESGVPAPIATANGTAALPGGTACVAVTLTNGGGPTTTTNLFAHDPAYFDFLGSKINPQIGPGTVPDKQVSDLDVDAGTLSFTVAGSNAQPIPDGVLYAVRFHVDPSTALGAYTLGPAEGKVVVTECEGDCNGDGLVSVGEVQQCINLFLGHPMCGATNGAKACTVADGDSDGTVSLSELQQCVSHFFGTCN